MAEVNTNTLHISLDAAEQEAFRRLLEDSPAEDYPELHELFEAFGI